MKYYTNKKLKKIVVKWTRSAIYNEGLPCGLSPFVAGGRGRGIKWMSNGEERNERKIKNL